jgi:hypothetical protein
MWVVRGHDFRVRAVMKDPSAISASLVKSSSSLTERTHRTLMGIRFLQRECSTPSEMSCGPRVRISC